MKTNQYDSASPSRKNMGKKPSLTETPGVYNRHPDATLGKYARSDNKVPIKFAETDINPKMMNPMDSMRKGKAPKATGSRVNNSKNRYDTNKKNVVGNL